MSCSFLANFLDHIRRAWRWFLVYRRLSLLDYREMSKTVQKLIYVTSTHHRKQRNHRSSFIFMYFKTKFDIYLLFHCNIVTLDSIKKN